MLALGYKIVKGDYEPLPSFYSQELANLVATMLLKDDQVRPSANEILSSAIVQKHMMLLAQGSWFPLADSKKQEFKVEFEASALHEGTEGEEMKIVVTNLRELLKYKKALENKGEVMEGKVKDNLKTRNKDKSLNKDLPSVLIKPKTSRKIFKATVVERDIKAYTQESKTGIDAEEESRGNESFANFVVILNH